MNKAKLGQVVLSLITIFQKLPTYVAYAQSYDTEPPTMSKEEAAAGFGGIIGTIYNLLYPIAIIYGIFEIIVAGYKIMRSEGEPKTLSEAKEHLTNSIVGIIFVILGVVILRIIISSFLGQTV